MGFSSKHPGEDFGEWIQQGTHSQCDVKAAVKMNLTSKGTKHFRKIGQEQDARGNTIISQIQRPQAPTILKRRFTVLDALSHKRSKAFNVQG